MVDTGSFLILNHARLGILTRKQAAASERPVPDAGDGGAKRHAGQAEQPRERRAPMLVTLLGMVTLVRLPQP